PAVLHHVAQPHGVADVLERVRVHDQDVRELAGLQRADVLPHADRLRAEDRRRAQQGVVGQAARGHGPHLPVAADALDLAVAARTSAARLRVVASIGSRLVAVALAAGAHCTPVPGAADAPDLAVDADGRAPVAPEPPLKVHGRLPDAVLLVQETAGGAAAGAG